MADTMPTRKHGIGGIDGTLLSRVLRMKLVVRSAPRTVWFLLASLQRPPMTLYNADCAFRMDDGH